MRPSIWHLMTLAGLLVFSQCRQSRAEGPLDELLARVPAQANTILIIDVPALHESPLGVRENWRKRHEGTYAEGVSSIPPSAQRVVSAAQLNTTTLQPVWEAVILDSPKPVTEEQLVRRLSGSKDKVSGQTIVLGRNNSYYTLLTPKMVGSLRPANRQEMARWVRTAKESTKPTVSKYLENAATGVNAKNQLVLALDLADVLDPDGIRERLKKCQALSGGGANLDALANELTSLKGVTFTLHVGNDLEGEVRLDFGVPPKAFAPVAKALVLEAMEKMGAALDDLDKWEAKAQSNSVILHGKLSEQTLRLLLSPFVKPTTVIESHQAESSGEAKLDPVILASMRYYRSVDIYLESLRKQQARNFNQQAKWYLATADNIDDLPILNVDDELIQYGQAVSSTLRGLGNTSQAVAAQNKQLGSNLKEQFVAVPGAYNYARWGYYGGYAYSVPGVEVQNNYSQIGNMMATNANTEGALRQQTWKNIKDYGNKVRLDMTKKYGIEFK
ncbi:MAG TPA: hypothetical protein VKE94_11085 [Gemmataceae bacterium]|nr:hypothetical protein [Gemmataceae bacterium]